MRSTRIAPGAIRRKGATRWTNNDFGEILDAWLRLPALYRGKQNGHVEDGFCYVVVESGSKVLLPITDHRMGSKRNHRQVMQLRVVTNAAQDLGSIHFGKGNIENDNIGLSFPKSFYRFESAGKLQNFILILQNRSNNQTIVRIVIHDCNFPHLLQMIPRELWSPRGFTIQQIRMFSMFELGIRRLSHSENQRTNPQYDQ